MISPINQRMFHGGIKASALADHLVAKFNDRQHRTHLELKGESALVQIGSVHGTPITVHITDTTGGVLVSMGRDRNWIDKIADASDIFERASSNPISLISVFPDIFGEFNKGNLAPKIWNTIYDICALTRSLAGENNAPENPIICEYCKTKNDPEYTSCISCGGELTIHLPRICPKCQRNHSSDALFCQACGTRLVDG